MNEMIDPKDQRIDLSRSGISRYIQLATLFRRRIETGVWQSGQQIPTVEDLAGEFGVARATIRQAIGILEGEGLISRFRAKGTFVNKLPEKPVWCEVETDWNGLLTSRNNARIQVLGDEAPVALPRLDGVPGQVSSEYRHLRRRHYREEVPYLLADVYIDARLAAGLDDTIFSTTTAMRIAASLPDVTVSNALQSLTVGSADLETAELLNIALNAPVCYVDRFAVDHRGWLILVSKGTYRGDIFRMDIKLR